MLFLFRPSVVFPLVFCALSLGAVHVAARGAHARFDAARRRVDGDCRAYRKVHPTANVCVGDRYGPSTVKLYAAQKAKLGAAARAADEGDEAAVHAAIRAALDDARKADERGTLIGSIVAAGLVDLSLDIVEKHPQLFPTPERRDLAKRARVRSAAHPFESERIDRLWGWAIEDGGFEDQGRLLPRSPFREAYLADAILQDDAIWSEMDRAAAADDLPRCEAAARGRAGLAPNWDFLCAKAIGVVHADARAKRMYEDALRGSDPPTPPRSP